VKPAYLITGSSGFIGSHVCHSAHRYLSDGSQVLGLDTAQPVLVNGYEHVFADIRTADSISGLPRKRFDAVIHLAARAEVITRFSDLGDLSLTNINGTANLLTALSIETFVFASSSAVYGSSGVRPTPPSFDRVRPVGTYGATKAFGELILADWCRTGAHAAVAVRFGNVVGPRCRGFIPFLVRHALKYPEGQVTARCRGGGRILRDYVPVDHVVSLLYASALCRWTPGTFTALNAGTGRGLTNGQVGEIVARVLQKRGYRLNVNYEAPLEPGESERIVLDVKTTGKILGVPVPSRDAVVAAIEEGTLSYLSQAAETAAVA
jgi:nucleoside-diphosphate-sugar epimerase